MAQFILRAFLFRGQRTLKRRLTKLNLKRDALYVGGAAPREVVTSRRILTAQMSLLLTNPSHFIMKWPKHLILLVMSFSVVKLHLKLVAQPQLCIRTKCEKFQAINLNL